MRRLNECIWDRRRDFKTRNAYRTESLLGVVVGSEESVLGCGVDDVGKVDKLGGGGGWRGWGRQRKWESGKRRRGVEWRR